MIHLLKSKQFHKSQILFFPIITIILFSFFYTVSVRAQAVNPIANKYYKKGLQAVDLSDKIKHFTKALEVDAEFIDAAYKLGITYYQKGQYEHAIDYLIRTKDLHAADFKDANRYLTNAYTFLATEFNEKEKYALAVTTALQALDIDDKFVPALTISGIAYLNLNDLQPAITTLEKSIALNPGQEEVWSKLGEIYLRTKDYLKSIKAYENALKIAPDLKEAEVHLKIAKRRINPEGLLAEYEELKNNHNLDDAIELLKKVKVLFPNHEKISSELQETIQERDYMNGLKAIEDNNWHLALEIFQKLDTDYKDTALKLEEIQTRNTAQMDSSLAEIVLEKLPGDSSFQSKEFPPPDEKDQKQNTIDTEPDLIANTISTETETTSKDVMGAPVSDKEPLKLHATAIEKDTLISALMTDSSRIMVQEKTLRSSKVNNDFQISQNTIWAISFIIGSLLIIGLVIMRFKNKRPLKNIAKNKQESTTVAKTLSFESTNSEKSALSNQTDDLFKDKVASITPVNFNPIDISEISEVESGVDLENFSHTNNEVNHVLETKTISGNIKKVKRIGRYVIEKEIGKGSMGLVYKAWDTKLDRTVVIKQIAFQFTSNTQEIAKLKDRLFREARAAGRLNHPNIVIIYDVEDEDNFSYLVMEYLPGQDLKKVMEKQGKFSLTQSLKIVKQICGALNFAHQNGIVHRDVKPSNIILTDGHRVKVADFGIAQLPHLETLTQTGSIVGTPCYMSPEQVEGRKLDGRSDIFSVGVILYEMLTSIHPFIGDNIPNVVYKIVHTNPKSPLKIVKDLPDTVDNILKRALAKEPGNRYATAGELITDLEKLHGRN